MNEKYFDGYLHTIHFSKSSFIATLNFVQKQKNVELKTSFLLLLG